MKKISLLNLLGFVLLFIIIFKIGYNLYYYDYVYTLFWYCNLAALILSIGILFKIRFLVGAVLVSSIPAQFLWFLDFFLFFLFGLGFGRTSDLFYSTTLFEFILSIVFHISIIPISIYAVLKLGLSIKSFISAFLIFVVLLLPLTFIFTPQILNINCVFYPCDLDFQDFEKLNLFNKNSLLYFMFKFIFWSFISLSMYLGYIFLLKKDIIS